MTALQLALLAVRRRVSKLMDRHFDLVNRTDTSRPIEPSDLDVLGPHRDRAVRYQPTRARSLQWLLRTLQIPREEVFVDIGSGKGRVLLIARNWGFRRVVGVEYAPSLCEIARSNLRSARAWAGEPQVVIHCCDAADYDFREDETVIYLFNPFDAFVLGRMMERLAQSLARAPRKVWLIYLFPRWHEVIEEPGLFTLEALHVHDDSEFAVYIHDPAAARDRRPVPDQSKTSP